jgi:hypothetical protein
MQINWTILLLASIIPMIMGFIWYNPKVFGTAWMKESGVTMDSAKGANMPLIFGLSFLFSFMVAMSLQLVVIHQFHIYSIFANDPTMSDPNSETGKYISDFMDKNGHNFRTFKHGALHGTLLGIFLAMPVIGTGALFERRRFKYTLISAGYWTVCFALMGGVICAFA